MQNLRLCSTRSMSLCPGWILRRLLALGGRRRRTRSWFALVLSGSGGLVARTALGLSAVFRAVRGGLHRAALFGVVADVPPGAFELNGRCGEQALHLAVTLGALLDFGSAEALDLLKLMTAFFAAVFVKRHKRVLQGSEIAGVASLRRKRPCIYSTDALPSKAGAGSIARQDHLANARDGRHRAQFLQGSLGGRSVDLQDGECCGRAFVIRTAEREVGDVDLVLAKDGADPADDAGHVLVANREQRALQRRLDVDAVEVQQPRRVSMQNRSAGDDAGVAGVKRKLEHGSCAAQRRFFLLFVQTDAAILRDGSGVDAVHLLEMTENAGDGAVADQLCLQIGEAAVVADGDAVDAAFGELADECAEALGELHVGSEFLVFLVGKRGQ